MTILLALLLASAALPDGITLTVPAGIDLTVTEVAGRIDPGTAPPGGRYDTAEIVIYHFSSGAETLSYGDGETMRQATRPGEIRALVKFKRKKKLVRALFVMAAGGDREAILDNFGRAIEAALKQR